MNTLLLNIKQWLKSYKFTYSIIAFMLARLELFGVINPVIIGFVSVFCYKSGFYTIAISAFLGLISIYGDMYISRYVISLALLSAFHILGNDKHRQCYAAGLSVLTAGLMFAMYFDFSLLYAMLAVAEAVLTASLNIILGENISILNIIDLEPYQTEEYPKELQRLVKERLNIIATAFSKVSRSCQKAYTLGTRSESEKEDIKEIFDSITEVCCQNCPLVDECWQEKCSHTYKVFYNAINSWLHKGFATVDEISDNIICHHNQELVAAAQGYIDMHREQRMWRERVRSIRLLASSQLADAGRVIEELSRELTQDMNIDMELSSKMYKGLTSNMVKSVVAFYIGNRPEIYIRLKDCHNCNKCKKDIVPTLKEISGIEFDVVDKNCVIENRDCILHLVQKPPLKLNIYAKSMGKDGSDVSGDSYTCVEIDRGKYMLALADGMGSGEMAQKESAATIELYEDFTLAGFNMTTTLDAINSVLLLDDSKECYSTLDICTIDLYSGEAEFVKVGAVSTIIVSGKNAEVLKVSSLPVGIIDKVDSEFFNRELKKGDIVVMVTDGVLDSNDDIFRREEWILDLINKRKNNNPKHICNEILRGAKSNYGGIIRDDMTIITAIIG